MRRGERGFLLLEAGLLGFFLVLLVGLALLPQELARMETRREAREAALFLAQQELAEMTARRTAFMGEAQTLGWLGAADDLAARPQDYTVTGTARPEAGGYALTAVVRWSYSGEQELTLSKWVTADEK